MESYCDCKTNKCSSKITKDEEARKRMSESKKGKLQTQESRKK
jgi:hypothetical protein